MSIRNQLLGINFQAFKNLFGCKDEAVAKKLKKRCKNYHGTNLNFDWEKKDYEEMLCLIDKLVMGEISPKQAEEHELFPGLLVNVLIWHNQDYIAAEGDNWSLFIKYLTRAKEKLNGKAAELQNQFLTGTAIFTEWVNLPQREIPYTFLKPNEVSKLVNYIENHKDVFYDSDGWGSVFPQFLKKINEKDMALIHYAS